MAIIVTGVVADTLPAVPAKVVVVLPAGTLTEAGTVRAALLSDTATSRPPVGATLFKVTVHVVVVLDKTATGEQLNADGTIGATRLRVALVVVPFRLAVNSAVLSAVTVDTEAANPALDAPAGTPTDTGVETNVLLSVRATTAPPAGAIAVNIAVHVADAPEPSVVGVHVSEASVTGGVRLIDAALELPFNAAVTVTV